MRQAALKLLLFAIVSTLSLTPAFAQRDMGTLLVVQHLLEDGRLVNAVYMHGGDTVFVKPGERVACGQLLGTMGLSFSAENGGWNWLP